MPTVPSAGAGAVSWQKYASLEIAEALEPPKLFKIAPLNGNSATVLPRTALGSEFDTGE